MSFLLYHLGFITIAKERKISFICVFMGIKVNGMSYMSLYHLGTNLMDEQGQPILPPGRVAMTIIDCAHAIVRWVLKLEIGVENCLICIAEGSDIQDVTFYKNAIMLQSDDSRKVYSWKPNR